MRNPAKNIAIAITKNSFKITGRGVILDLQHQENGLPQGTELISKKSRLSWKVISRVLFDHAVSVQKNFKNEAVDFMTLKFDSIQKQQESIDAICQQESRNIFQYFLSPVNHEGKPQEGEELEIKFRK